MQSADYSNDQPSATSTRESRMHNLFPRLGRIDQVPQQDDLAMPQQSSSRYTAQALLQGHALIISVHCLLQVDLEQALALTTWTKGDLHLSRGILIKWPKDSFTFNTVKLDVFELGKHARVLGDDARDAHERELRCERWRSRRVATLGSSMIRMWISEWMRLYEG